MLLSSERLRSETMRRLGVEYVVVDADRYPDRGRAIRAEAEASKDFGLVARDGDLVLFRVQP